MKLNKNKLKNQKIFNLKIIKFLQVFMKMATIQIIKDILKEIKF